MNNTPKKEGGGLELVPIEGHRVEEDLQEQEGVVLEEDMEKEILGSEEDVRCGFWFMQASWLQYLARAEVFLVVFAMVSLIQGMVFAYMSGTLTTIERRFGFSSKISGILSTGNDVTQVLFSMLIAQIAGRGHRPRWIAMSLILSIVACLLMAAPHALFGAGHFARTNSSGQSSIDKADLCPSSKAPSCADSTGSMGEEQVTVFALHFISQTLSGFGTMLYYTVGYTYLDEAVEKEKVPFFFGVSGMMRVFGPVCGYALSSWTLNMWVDPFQDPQISPTHPQWVGAWWVGYLVIAAMLIPTIFFMMFVPRTLPSARERSVVRLRAAAKLGKKQFEEYKKGLRKTGQSAVQGMKQSLRRLFGNKIFVLMNLNQMSFWCVVVSYALFQTKYIEQYYGKSASEANEDLAVVGLVSTSLGWTVFGSLITFGKPSTMVILVINMLISVGLASTYIAMMMVKCEPREILGVESILRGKHLRGKSNQELSSLQSCMDGCDCSSFDFKPTCSAVNSHFDDELPGPQAVTFFNPCYAGCQGINEQEGPKTFRNCSCVREISNFERLNVTTKEGLCPSPCPNFGYFIVLVGVKSFFVAASRSIANIVFFRAVEERDKDLSLGFLNVVVCLTLIVGPIGMGMIADWCCLLWKEVCGSKSFCFLYRLEDLQFFLHIIPAGGILICLMTEGVLLWLHEEIDFLGQKEKKKLGIGG